LLNAVEAGLPNLQELQQRRVSFYWLFYCSFVLVALSLACGAVAKPSPARQPDQNTSDVPEGFAIDLKASEADVLKAVELVTQDTILHGTQVYAREDELTEAEAATGSAYYGPWTGPGHAFYKVRKQSLSPQHFKNSTDVGTITVRYIVLGVAPNRTHLQIDAVFVEDGSKRVHPSDTTVETKFKAISCASSAKNGKPRTCCSAASCKWRRNLTLRNATRRLQNSKTQKTPYRASNCGCTSCSTKPSCA
jgi:hypothetical protein